MKAAIWLLMIYLVYKYFFKRTLLNFGRSNPSDNAKQRPNGNQENEQGHAGKKSEEGSSKSSPFETEGEYVDFEEIE